MKLITTFFLLLLIVSCTTKSKPFFCKCDTFHVSKNDSLIKSQFTDPRSYRDFLNRWNIPPLSSYKKECYRFIMRHAFSKYTQIYTLIKQDNRAKLIVSEYQNPQTSKKQASINKHYELILSETNWRKIKREIETKCCWTNPAAKYKNSGLDGGSWVLEGYDHLKQNCANRTYHIDVCAYNDSYGPSNLGEICRIIKKFAKEERLNIH